MNYLETKNSGSIIANLKQRRSMMSGKELAEILGVSTDTIYSLRKRAKIPVVRIGGSHRFDPGMIANWLELNNGIAKTGTGKTVWLIVGD